MSHKIKSIEKNHGRPMRDLLIDLYREKGTTKAVAKELKIGPSTVTYWLMKSHLSIQSVLVDDRTGERVS